MKNIKDDGFTFIETIAVVAIMLILSASIGVSTGKYINQARRVSVINQIEQIRHALHSYNSDCGIYPTEEQGLDALFFKPTIYPIPKNWSGPYLEKQISVDAWGNKYIYKIKNNFGLPFVIYSLGADGLEGGEKENEDILSWK